MPTPPSVSRPAPPDVAPVVHDGIRYEQDTHDDRVGDQPGGYLVAVDGETGKRLWRIKVYELAAVPAGLPRFARYLRSVRVAPGGKALTIEDEVGCVYRVDLASHASERISEPVG